MRVAWKGQTGHSKILPPVGGRNEEPYLADLTSPLASSSKHYARTLPIYHGAYVAMVKPDIGGPMFEPDESGMQTWNRYRFASGEAQIYRTDE